MRAGAIVLALAFSACVLLLSPLCIITRADAHALTTTTAATTAAVLSETISRTTSAAGTVVSARPRAKRGAGAVAKKTKPARAKGGAAGAKRGKGKGRGGSKRGGNKTAAKKAHANTKKQSQKTQPQQQRGKKAGNKTAHAKTKGGRGGGKKAGAKSVANGKAKGKARGNSKAKAQNKARGQGKGKTAGAKSHGNKQNAKKQKQKQPNGKRNGSKSKSSGKNANAKANAKAKGKANAKANDAKAKANNAHPKTGATSPVTTRGVGDAMNARDRVGAPLKTTPPPAKTDAAADKANLPCCAPGSAGDMKFRQLARVLGSAERAHAFVVSRAGRRTGAGGPPCQTCGQKSNQKGFCKNGQCANHKGHHSIDKHAEQAAADAAEKKKNAPPAWSAASMANTDVNKPLSQAEQKQVNTNAKAKEKAEGAQAQQNAAFNAHQNEADKAYTGFGKHRKPAHGDMHNPDVATHGSMPSSNLQQHQDREQASKQQMDAINGGQYDVIDDPDNKHFESKQHYADRYNQANGLVGKKNKAKAGDFEKITSRPDKTYDGGKNTYGGGNGDQFGFDTHAVRHTPTGQLMDPKLKNNDMNHGVPLDRPDLNPQTPFPPQLSGQNNNNNAGGGSSSSSSSNNSNNNNNSAQSFDEQYPTLGAQPPKKGGGGAWGGGNAWGKKF